jgi:putative flippase GtrA
MLELLLIKWSLCCLNLFRSNVYKAFLVTKRIFKISFLDYKKFKYAFIGCINVGLSWVVYLISFHLLLQRNNVVLFSLITISAHVFALILSFIFVTVSGFFLNFYFVFKSSNTNIPFKLFKYFISNSGSLILNYIFLKIFVDLLHWWPFFSQVLASSLTVFYSYLMQNRFTFNKRH